MTAIKSPTRSTPAASTTINGIDTADLRDCIAAISADPREGATTWTINSRWKGGTRADHHVDACRIAGANIERKFTISTDEPHELCGTNQFANPQECLLAGLNACMMVGYTAVAALMGIRLTSLEVCTTGDIDLRGFLGISPDVPAGYPSLRQEVRIAGDATPERFAELHNIVKATSPNFFNITRAIPVTSSLIVDAGSSACEMTL
ncbi:MAG: OsmC family protein [Phycisphaerales bacterium]|nr:OsmC family protein [Phycisphaerales bacterium]